MRMRFLWKKKRGNPQDKVVEVPAMVVKYGLWEVDVDSPLFLEKVKWVAEKVEALTYKQVPYFNPIYEGEGDRIIGHHMYINIIFSSVGTDVGADAVLLSRNPEVSVNEIRMAFGLPQIDPAPRFEQQVSEDSPVGAPWPAKGARVFHVSDAFNEVDYPEGSLFQGKLEGRNVTWKRERVVIAVGSGPFGIGGKTAPSWGLVG